MVMLLSQHLAYDGDGVLTQQSSVTAPQAVGILEPSNTVTECGHILLSG